MLIDGRAIGAELKDELRGELARAGGRAGIATLLVGEDLGAEVYQRRIDRNANEVGIVSRPERMPADATLGQIIGKIAELDADPDITGILVLRPLPAHLPESRIFQSIPPLKDVEALHPENFGLLSLGTPRFIPSTPAAAFHMLDCHTRAMGRDPEHAYDGIDLVIVGRSNNVGKPAAILGLQRNASVISVDKYASDAGRLADHTKTADVLIVAVGVPELIDGSMVREGAIVIDIGINAKEGPDGKVGLTGDCDTASVEAVAEAVSPVPGGVGPITDVWVLRNTVIAARMVHGA
jgi:methylenetetrahydrofolate dehydrogenase (NADP+)/methenyltetrahydrofolate cyclohydrolase